jgi:hypothetical protein
MQSQPQQQQFVAGIEDDWKINSQKTIEHRRKVLGFMQQKLPNVNPSMLNEIEKQCFNETQSKVNKTFKKIISNISTIKISTEKRPSTIVESRMLLNVS